MLQGAAGGAGTGGSAAGRVAGWQTLGGRGDCDGSPCLTFFSGRSDTTIAPNNGVWGAPKNPAGTPMCPTVGWVNGSCSPNGVAPGGGNCTPWNITASINYAGTKLDNFGVNVSTANGYFPNSPAPCWANTAPTSYDVSAVTGYSIMDATGTSPVPHFLDFSSVLFKDVNGEVHRQKVPAGACLPGNLVNVRTSAFSYTVANPAVKPVYPPSNAVAYPTGANQIYTTTNDAVSGEGLTTYTPRSQQATPNSSTNGGQPATLDTIRVYFALNFGLRNALDNACDGRIGKTTKSCVNGGYYVSNLTTALLGDDSKGLGRATYAVIRLCHSPMSTTDRPWRKKSGDAVNNKQCMDVKQLLFGANTELIAAPLSASNATPNAVLAIGSSLAVIRPMNAVSGIAVNDVPLSNYTDGNVSSSVISFYKVNKTTGPANAPSPVAFCRPLSNSSFASGVDPDSSKGVFFNASKLCQQNQFTNNTPVDCASNCVMSGGSWSVTKGTNMNLNDPAWYTVDIILPADMPRGNYFVRVFALDANLNYLGFGSSATSANLTNTASQNYFHVANWASTSSTGVRGGDALADIRAGAAGCSAMSLLVATIFLVREIRASRSRRANSLAPTTVVADDRLQTNPLGVPAAAEEIGKAAPPQQIS